MEPSPPLRPSGDRIDGAPPPTGPPPPTPSPNRLRGAPVTTAIVALNVIAFVVQIALGYLAPAFQDHPEGAQLALGANYGLATVNEHRIETLITSCFLHGGVMHIAFNMIVLVQAGALVEKAVGSARMAPMYLFSGLVGSVFSAAINWFRVKDIFSVGASGAIMGVLAAAMVLGWRAQGWKGPLTQLMVRWLGANLVLGVIITQLGGNTDNAAHIGGAVAGAMAALLWKRGYVYSARAKAMILVACALVVVASGATVALHNVVDPYAAMMTDQRVLVATKARLTGDCAAAHRVLAATQRLNPRNPKLAKERFAYAVDCGRPM